MNKTIISNLTQQAKDIDKKLNELYKTDAEIQALYRGASLWYSPIVENPEVMFLGINPGAGFYNNNNNQLCHFFEPLKIMEYTDPKQDYQLKWEWMYIFGEKGLNRLDVLSKSVKTNFCYLATEDEAALKKLFTQIRGKLNIAPYEVFGNWTRQVVQQIHPKLLICEGKLALEFLRDWSFKNEYKEIESAADLRKGQIGDIKVLQVSRARSTLKNADGIISEIGKLI